MPSAVLTTTKLVVRSITVAALAACALSANASFMVYTDQETFLSAIANPGTDSYDDLDVGSIFGSMDTPSRIDRSAGSYSYSASVDGGFYAAGSTADPFLSSVNMATITFDGFSSGVQAVGGYFFATDLDGAYLPGETLTVTAVDQFGASATRVLLTESPTNFLGFVSSGNVSSVSFAVVDNGLNNAFGTANDLSLGEIPPVPEPSTYALMLAGLGVVGVVARRRRRG